MLRKRNIKISVFIIGCLILVAYLYYNSLPNRHKAIVKTKIAHSINLVDSEWNTNTNQTAIVLNSPTLIIDNIYKSMEGPKAIKHFSFFPKKDSLFWMTGFKVEAENPKNKEIISNDFICHFNIDYNDQDHNGRWNYLNRIGEQFPRLISLSHGIESVNFPPGFGYPFFGNESFFISTQALNHNLKDTTFLVQHNININYSKNKNIKPLRPKTVYMMLPFDKEEPYKAPEMLEANTCIPVETKNHTYYNDKGEILSGHWKIFQGTQSYSYNATKQLNINDTISVHQITPHLHPFAEKLILKDITKDTILYQSNVINHKDRIGLEKTPSYSSTKGFKMYPDHEYEITLITNNTSQREQDMMASMFLFYYDKELDSKINKYHENM